MGLCKDIDKTRLKSNLFIYDDSTLNFSIEATEATSKNQIKIKK